jgi:hypothetical protein
MLYEHVSTILSGLCGDKIMISPRNNFHSSPLSSSPACRRIASNFPSRRAPPPQVSTSRAPFLFQHYLPFQFPRTHNDLDARAKFTAALEGLRWTSLALLSTNCTLAARAVAYLPGAAERTLGASWKSFFFPLSDMAQF